MNICGSYAARLLLKSRLLEAKNQASQLKLALTALKADLPAAGDVEAIAQAIQLVLEAEAIVGDIATRCATQS